MRIARACGSCATPSGTRFATAGRRPSDFRPPGSRESPADPVRTACVSASVHSGAHRCLAARTGGIRRARSFALAVTTLDEPKPAGRFRAANCPKPDQEREFSRTDGGSTDPPRHLWAGVRLVEGVRFQSGQRETGRTGPGLTEPCGKFMPKQFREMTGGLAGDRCDGGIALSEPAHQGSGDHPIGFAEVDLRAVPDARTLPSGPAALPRCKI